MLATIGFILMIVLMIVLIKGWVSPPVAFISLPIIAALCAGFGFGDIGGFIGSGMKSMLSTAVLFVFSISYFTLMDEIGLFNPIINLLTKKAGSKPKLLRITNPIARGIAIGTSSHAIGTSKALEIGQVEGAMSSLSIAVAGILTAIACPAVVNLLPM